MITPKKQRFALEYLIDLNATQAAIRAGYSKKSAGAIGDRLLKDVDIQLLLKEQMATKDKAAIADADEVLTLLTKIARGDIEEEVVVVENTGNFRSRAKKFRKEVQPKDQVKALELLGRRHGLFTDNMNLKADMSVVVIDDVND